MKNTDYLKGTLFIMCIAFLASCTTPKATDATVVVEEEAVVKEISYNVEEPKSIIEAVAAASGSWNALWDKKDVQFDYSYKYPQSGQEDLSVERYIFDTEESWAKFSKHEINAFPEDEGEVVQYYDGASTIVYKDSVQVDNPEVIGGAQFLRKANYFWFVMMYKLDNPGAQYEYLGEESLDSVKYDKVKVTYDSTVTSKPQNDIYVLYVNAETKKVDQFYFSLPILGVNDPIILMKLKYETIEGLDIPAVRHVYMPSPEGYSAEPNLVQTSTNIKFNNGFTSETILK